MGEIEPIYVDRTGQPYYFGTSENPFNFRVINEIPRSAEAARLIADGGVVLDLYYEPPKAVGYSEDLARIAKANLRLRRDFN